MENTAVLNVRISEQLKQQLSKLAQEKNETVSDLVREMLARAVTPDSDSVLSIPPELMVQIRKEAHQRGRSEAYMIERGLQFAFGNLFIGSTSLRRW